MKGRRLLAAAILVVPASVLLAVPTAQTSTARSKAFTAPAVLHAQTTGEHEVPGPGDPNGFGTATIALFPSSDKICYTLTASQNTVKRKFSFGGFSF